MQTIVTSLKTSVYAKLHKVNCDLMDIAQSLNLSERTIEELKEVIYTLTYIADKKSACSESEPCEE